MLKAVKNENFKFLLVITVFYLLVTTLMWGYVGNSVFSDIGREAYIPAQMLKGQLLYKDILNIYGPAGYQINALLYFVFGTNFNTLLIAGAVNGLFFSIIVYFLSRKLTSKLVSFALTIFIMSIYIFTFNGFIIPYSYSIAYATTTICTALLCLLRFIDSRSIKFFYIACLLTGLSIVLKYEYLGFLGILFIVAIVKKLKLYEILLSGIFFLLLPLTSLILLIISGVSLQDIKDGINFMLTLSATDSLRIFYQRFSWFIPSGIYLVIDISSFIVMFILLCSVYVLIRFVLNFTDTLRNAEKIRLSKFTINTILITISLSIIYIFFSNPNFFYRMLGWLPLSILIILIMFWYKKRNLILSKENITYVLLCLCALVFSLKGFIYCSLIPYGTFLLPIPTIIFYASVYQFLSKRFPNTRNFEKAYAFTLVVFSVSVASLISLSVRNAFPELLYGSTHVESAKKTEFSELINYIKTNTQPSEKVLIIPEGQMINFLADRDSDNVLSTIFFPPLIEAYGEDKAISRLAEQKIQTLVILKREMQEYLSRDITHEPYFGEEVGQKTFQYILENYTLVKTIGIDNFVTIYKLK